jgi:hypothetical protein
MAERQQKQHNYRHANMYWDELTVTGFLCPVTSNPFTICLDNKNLIFRPEKFQT